MQTKTTASGVNLKPVSIKGKDYVTVAQRIAEVNASTMTPRFEILETRFIEYAGQHLCQAIIRIDGKQFIGTASVNLGGKGVDATNPIENAETSALGRALGLAGFGSLESVATAEEVVTAISRKDNGYQSKAPANGLATPEQLARIEGLCFDIDLKGTEFSHWLRDSYGTSWSKIDYATANQVIEGLKSLKETFKKNGVA